MKGRIERLWGTAQDRLRSELPLAGAATREEANAVLADYLGRHNARFAVPAADPASAWRALPAERPPEALFCFRHPRRVARDGTFTLAGQSLMIACRVDRGRLGQRLEIQERLDGSRWAEIDGIFHPVVAAPERPIVLRTAAAPPPPAIVPRPPAPDHPWSRYPTVRPR